MSSSTSVNSNCERTRSSWDYAFDCYTTQRIFARRAGIYSKRIKSLTVSGIIIPFCLGLVAVTWSDFFSNHSWILPVAAIALFLQAMGSAWSVLVGWPAELEYCLESAADHRAMQVEFEEIANQHNSPEESISTKYERVYGRYLARDTADQKKNVTEKEMRRAYRAGLFWYKRTCPTCEKMPTSFGSEKSTCNSCGNFK
ncbi:MAG TPA: hypothetical protein DD803_04930 [Alcaligenes faecalis]|nr:mobilome CxxCx(11)CxxC protein [Alcaligenes faecalis]HBQ88788.1 hypothetical protein [Alcaligenes faecalis]